MTDPQSLALARDVEQAVERLMAHLRPDPEPDGDELARANVDNSTVQICNFEIGFGGPSTASMAAGQINAVIDARVRAAVERAKAAPDVNAELLAAADQARRYIQANTNGSGPIGEATIARLEQAIAAAQPEAKP